jgi:RNase P subunit RPR2
MKKSDRKEAEEKLKEFFENIKNKTPREIKKMKKLTMKQNIRLGELRKKFCKKCFSSNLIVKNIRNKIKSVECFNCKNVMRWRIK